MTTSLFIAGLAILFWWHQNQFFGWNWKPQSAAEVLADGLVAVLLAISIAVR